MIRSCPGFLLPTGSIGRDDPPVAGVHRGDAAGGDNQHLPKLAALPHQVPDVLRPLPAVAVGNDQPPAGVVRVGRHPGDHGA